METWMPEHVSKWTSHLLLWNSLQLPCQGVNVHPIDSCHLLIVFIHSDLSHLLVIRLFLAAIIPCWGAMGDRNIVSLLYSYLFPHSLFFLSGDQNGGFRRQHCFNDNCIPGVGIWGSRVTNWLKSWDLIHLVCVLEQLSISAPSIFGGCHFWSCRGFSNTKRIWHIHSKLFLSCFLLHTSLPLF